MNKSVQNPSFLGLQIIKLLFPAAVVSNQLPSKHSSVFLRGNSSLLGLKHLNCAVSWWIVNRLFRHEAAHFPAVLLRRHDKMTTTPRTNNSSDRASLKPLTWRQEEEPSRCSSCAEDHRCFPRRRSKEVRGKSVNNRNKRLVFEPVKEPEPAFKSVIRNRTREESERAAFEVTGSQI